MTCIATNIIAGCMSVVFIILAVFAIAFALRGLFFGALETWEDWKAWGADHAEEE